MALGNHAILRLALAVLVLLAGCSPYYGRLDSSLQHQMDQATAARAAGDRRGACAILAAAAAESSHPAVLIQHGRCLTEADGGAQDLAGARAAFERAYAMRSPLKGRAALWLAIVERQSGGSAAAQVAWLERARALGESGTESLLLKAWSQDPQTYRAELLAAYERRAASDPYSALELARLVAADPATDPASRAAQAAAAIRALEVGARAGNSGYARTLAWLYRDGELTPEDPVKFRHWLTAAAHGGDVRALTKLAELAQAEGDLDAARGWLEQAVAAGDGPAAVTLSRGYLAGRFSPADRPAAAALIARTAAADPSPALQLEYGKALLDGVVVGRDPELGRVVLERVAAAPYAPAQTELGRRCLRGLSLPADPERGRTLLETSAAAGDPGAMFILARAYLDGDVVARNAPQGIDWLQRAARAGSQGAMLELARRRLRGLDVPADAAQGRAMLEALAAAGHAGAMLQLGKAYASGDGLAHDPAQARNWLTRAARSGSVEAQRLLHG